MKMPAALQGYFTPAQWKSLKIERLDDESKGHVLDVACAAFQRFSPEKVSKHEVQEVVDFVKGLADDFACIGDDETTEGDLAATENTSSEMAREKRREHSRKKARSGKP